MNSLQLKNKKAQDGLGDIMKWILYLAILIASGVAFRFVILGARG